MSGIGYRRDIDGLRSIAVVPVVLGHAGIVGFSGGFVGVDVFFVISGFLITSILIQDLEDGRFSLLRFYERRARRILPALFFLLIFVLSIGLLFYRPHELYELSKATITVVFFSSNYWFWKISVDYFGQSAELLPLLHTWSLAVEEQFYIFFPILLWALFRSGRAILSVAISVISLASFLLSVWLTLHSPSASFFLLPTRIWELGVGALLALGVFPSSRSRWIRELAASLGLLLILVPVYAYTKHTPFPGIAALPPCLGAVLMIWAGAQGETRIGDLLSHRLPVAVGLVSYSLYLWHWPILVFFRQYTGSIDLPLAAALSAIALSLLMAAFSWRFVERPFRKKGGNGLSQAGVFIASGFSALLISLIAGVIYLGNGFPQRIPSEIRRSVELATSGGGEFKECLGNSSGRTGFCEIGLRNGRRDVLLWGDSHASAAIPGVDEWMKSEGFGGTAATWVACVPIPGTISNNREDARMCTEFNDQVLEIIQDTDDFPLVILHARWAAHAEGIGPYEDTKDREEWMVWEDPSRPLPGGSNPDYFAVFEEGLSETVEAILATGREVLIIASVPEVGWSVPAELMNGSLLWWRDTPSPPSLQDFRGRNARVEAVLEELEKREGVTVLHLGPSMCKDTCEVMRGDVLLYMDGDHLSNAGARIFLTELLRDQVGAKVP